LTTPPFVVLALAGACVSLLASLSSLLASLLRFAFVRCVVGFARRWFRRRVVRCFVLGVGASLLRPGRASWSWGGRVRARVARGRAYGRGVRPCRGRGVRGRGRACSGPERGRCGWGRGCRGRGAGRGRGGSVGLASRARVRPVGGLAWAGLPGCVGRMFGPGRRRWRAISGYAEGPAAGCPPEPGDGAFHPPRRGGPKGYEEAAPP